MRRNQQQSLSSSSTVKADAQLRKSYSDLEKRYNEAKNRLFEEQAKSEALSTRIEELQVQQERSSMSRHTLLHHSPGNQTGGLERLRQSLEYLAVRLKNEFDWTINSQLKQIRCHLDEIIDELKHLASEVGGQQYTNGAKQQQHQRSSMVHSQQHISSSFETKIIEQNHELIETIKRLNGEKSELINALSRLEEEVWQYRNRTKVSFIRTLPASCLQIVELTSLGISSTK